MKKRLKPIIRIPGSKHKLYTKIFEGIEFKNYQNFIDVFGGSLTIGGNIAFLNPHLNSFINDFNGFYNQKLKKFDREKIILNQIRFSGFGTPTDLGIKQLHTKLNNNFLETIQAWDKLSKENLIIESKKWEEFVLNKPQGKDVLYYFDPPYFGKQYIKLYQHSVEHEKLFNFLLNFKEKFILSINDCPEIRKIFTEHKGFFVKEIKATYTITAQSQAKKTQELVISNFKY